MSHTSAETLELLTASSKFVLHGSGKARELFAPVDFPQLLGVYVTDRWSARDFNFGFALPNVGMLRNTMTIHWKRKLRRAGFRTDLHRYGKSIDDCLSNALHGNRTLWKRMTFVDRHVMIPYELIYRFNNVGSMFEASSQGRTEFCGNNITPYMQFGTEFPEGIATPTTKEKKGHDKDTLRQKIEEEWPGLIEAGRKVACFIHDTLADGTLGNLIDIKLEMAWDPVACEYVLCDEISPDSCRFCLREDYVSLLQGNRDVPFYDKEYGRQWADGMGIRAFDPLDPRDCEVVASWHAPEWFLKEFMRRLDVAFYINTMHNPPDYAKQALGIE